MASESIQAAKQQYDDELYGDLVNTISAIRNLSLGVGLLVGPILGELLTQFIGFRWAMDVFFFLLTILLIWDIVDHNISKNKRADLTPSLPDDEDEDEEGNLLKAKKNI